jgi:hypothetical protein
MSCKEENERTRLAIINRGRRLGNAREDRYTLSRLLNADSVEDLDEILGVK